MSIFSGVILPAIIAIIVLGGVLTLVDSIINFFKGKEYTEEEINALVNDAGELYICMKNSDYDPFENDLFLIDRDTVLRILRAVDDYNNEVIRDVTVEYTYRVEKGTATNMPTIDAYGNLGEIPPDPDPTPSPSESPDPTPSPSGVPGVVKPGASPKPTGPSIEVASIGMFNLDRMYAPMTIAEPIVEKEELAQTQEPKRIKYHVEYRDANVVLKRSDIDKERKIGGVEEDVFYMRWQPVVALCCMYINSNYDNWYSEKTEEGKKYIYLSDSDIEMIIDIFSYKYRYKSDITNMGHVAWNTKIGFEDFSKGISAYKIQGPIVTTNTSTGEITRITRYVPAIAPLYIKNTHISYEYVYTTLPTGDEKLTERVFSFFPERLVNKMESVVEDFSKNLFIEYLEILPGSEDLANYYKNVIFPYAKEKKFITNSTKDALMCPAIGTIVNKNDNTTGGDNSSVNGKEVSYYMKLFPSDGWNDNGVYLRPGEWLIEEGEEYGLYGVYAGAIDVLTSSDKMTEKEIYKFLKNYPFDLPVRRNCPFLQDENVMKEAAKCLFLFQENTGASVSGLLAIMIQEGGLYSSLGKNQWNFLSITATSSWKYGTFDINGHKFRDYKSKYEEMDCDYEYSCVGALEDQLYWVFDNYWDNGQNTYYKMIWNQTNVHNSETVYSGISHSYCPPWQDRAMPYSEDSHVGEMYYWKNSNSDYVGWMNRCAEIRTSILEYIEEM